METILGIVFAVVLGIMAIRLWPAAKAHFEHGPKGSASDWKAVAFPIALVVGFVVLLILMVR